MYYVLCILLIHVLTETFTGLQQVREAEFPVVEVMLILDSFYLCIQWSYSLLQSTLLLGIEGYENSSWFLKGLMKDLYNFSVNHVMHMLFVMCLWNTAF